MIHGLREYDPHQIIIDTAVDHGEDIARYVTEIQLYMEGTRGSDGEFIADYDPYAFVTIQIKQVKGQPTDRVTLRDTGDFHASFEVQPEGDGFRITATDPKTDELVERYGEGILALSDEHLESIKQKLMLPALQEALRKALYNG